LYVGGLDNQVSETQLRELFSECGRIVSVALKGAYAFVELENPDEAEKAIDQFHGKVQFGGRRLVVEKSMNSRQSSMLFCSLFSL
jgi:RNA recognition motif-containing protein